MSQIVKILLVFELIDGDFKYVVFHRQVDVKNEEQLLEKEEHKEKYNESSFREKWYLVSFSEFIRSWPCANALRAYVSMT